MVFSIVFSSFVRLMSGGLTFPAAQMMNWTDAADILRRSGISCSGIDMKGALCDRQEADIPLSHQ
ncbi:MAG: hypothetical protein IJG94_08340 [Clostridia bacterium]|nr:hypothetical protein [Clostridia bacterium]